MSLLTPEDVVDEVFVDSLPEYLRCPICLCCLKNPYQTPCGHRFCQECILPILHGRQNVCPNDRTVIDLNNTFPDNAVKLQINSLKIRCPLEGCDWIGELSDKLLHLSKCKFVSVACESCGNFTLKTDLEEHMQECPQRKVQCKYCGAEVASCTLDSHFDICPEYLLSCELDCSIGIEIPRKAIQDHRAACPLAPVPCSMANYGCSEEVKRCKLEEHLQVCIPQHIGNLCQEIQDLRKETKDLGDTLAIQKEMAEQMEANVYPSAGQFTWRIDDIRGKITQAQSGSQMSSVMYSPSFYSLEAGYKLSLCIYPAGDNNQGYLSLYFVVMKGQFDEILQWPFQKRVYLSLLNTRGGQNVTKDIQPDPRLHYFSRPQNPRNVGYGYPKFMSLLRLLPEESEFVENGAIFLRCRIFD